MEKLAIEIENVLRITETKKQWQDVPSIIGHLDNLSIRMKDRIEMNSLSKFHRESLLEVQRCIALLKESSEEICVTREEKEALPSSQESDSREKAIGETIMKAGDVRFNDIAGLDVVKSLLHEAVILPVQYPHLFTGKVKPWKSILLYGPPGEIQPN